MLFALSAVVDVALVAFLVTHTSGSVSDLALIGGGIVALWGVLHPGDRDDRGPRRPHHGRRAAHCSQHR